ncbi:helix-turn-helix transcriptional regulator [Streptomyces albicerus]|uniref:helix-turn-helix transcriptional regulator n=1 Tax=Streptomyces albicerus TaxID=2569859 RepID=UPI001788BDE2|nr:LuxR C-terminal-related transcriptional regulator [Streptomyces albicerus]
MAVVLTSQLSEKTLRMLLRHGAGGILLRDDSVEHLPWAVRAAAAGSIALAPAAAHLLVDQYVRPGRLSEEAAAARDRTAALSPRESEILRLLAEGTSNPDMAEAMGISSHTVKDHIRAVYTKLRVDNRVQAARIAWQAQAAQAAERGQAQEHTRSENSVQRQGKAHRPTWEHSVGPMPGTHSTSPVSPASPSR